ncbi:ATP-binding protein [Ferrimonas pelagia]|uniref:AAA family ATPase n=1 Tax=Ferrimonas pelagia TaxID=1177826 RepID=A0ABP9EIA3_9GAMM
MAIAGFTRIQVLERLYEVSSASQPIHSPERLFGRDAELEKLEDALHAPGRHAFIYGERGVGKSSLAHSVACQVQSSDNSPILVTAGPTATLVSILRDVHAQAQASCRASTVRVDKVSVGIAGLKYESQWQAEQQRLEVNDIGSALLMLNQLSTWHSTRPVVVIDEFDTIESSAEREMFGTLLKHLGDARSGVKLIFTGIGDSLNSLIGGHLSSTRQLHQVSLERLNWDGRYQIIDSVMEAFGLQLPDEIRFRMAGMSDGFPSYIHLMAENIVLAAHRADRVVESIDFDLFLIALDESVKSALETWRDGYDKATLGRPEHMAHLLWAAADSADHIRQTQHIEHSYSSICESLHVEPLGDAEFKREFAKLRKPSHGEILQRGLANRPGWFGFSESMMRGLVRMQAQLNGIVVDFERHFVSNTTTVKATAKHGYYQPLTQTEANVARLRREPTY